MSHPTIPEHLRRVAESNPTSPALTDPVGEVSHAELAGQIESTARAFRALDLPPGARVGLALEPSIPYVTAVLGAMAAGLTPVLMNTRLAPPETAAFLRPLSADLIVHDTAHAGWAAEVRLDRLLMDTTAEQASPRARMAPLDGRGLTGPLPPVGADAPALILPTGGTTGGPKGVWFDHAALWRGVAASAANLPRLPEDRDLYFAPFFHIMFPAQLLYSLFTGGHTEILPGFDAGRALDAIARGATRLGGAPTLMARLRRHPDFERVPRERITQILYGSAPSSTEFVESLVRDYPNARIHSLYGATEYGGPVTSIRHEDLLAGRQQGVGRCWPGQQVRVVDDLGNPCPPGTTGYFSVRSLGQANGYWGLPQATEAAFQPEGVRVGDMGRTDGEGWFHLDGRDSEMIVTGGENVFPSEVEQVLHQHASVRDALVFGVPDDDWGARVEALVVPEPGAALVTEELLSFARTRIARYKLPKHIQAVDALPLTANSKPDRAAAIRLVSQPG
ncbi:class I adenylate-forming enzyme family protein [Streptomyces sp. NPDC005811]|uniref:class I adenylate-forming enzyme family protein n=1 Tax=Streptomyces sp. NPDC005811 TaxID=3154565 RepID=UPI0033F39784